MGGRAGRCLATAPQEARGGRRTAGGVRGRGPRASPPAGPAAAAAAASSGSRPWPPAPGAWPSRSAPRSGRPTGGRQRGSDPRSRPDPRPSSCLSWPRSWSPFSGPQLAPLSAAPARDDGHARARPRWRRGRGAGTGRTRAGEESGAGGSASGGRPRELAREARGGAWIRTLKGGGRPLAPCHPRRRARGRPALDVPPVAAREMGILFGETPPGIPEKAQGLRGGRDCSPFARAFTQ